MTANYEKPYSVPQDERGRTQEEIRLLGYHIRQLVEQANRTRELQRQKIKRLAELDGMTGESEQSWLGNER